MQIVILNNYTINPEPPIMGNSGNTYTTLPKNKEYTVQ